MFQPKHVVMNRLHSLPIIGILICLLVAYSTARAQSHFTATVTGKGKPMIFIHGLYCSGDVWKETVARYSQSYECHVLTLAGFGGNAPNLHDNFLASVKDDLITYIKSNKLRKPVLVGHSMGAFIAFWTAAAAPQTFGKVIAVDGLPFLPDIQMPGATPESMKGMAENMRKSMENQTPEQIRHVQTTMYLPTMITSQEQINQVADIAAKADPKTQAQVMYELFTVDLRPLIKAIDCPVLLMGAWIAYKNYGVTHDSALAGYTRQVTSVPACTVVLHDTAKHFIFYDDPAWFYNQMDTFLQK